MSWADQTVWITGASSGIGEALARHLGAQGAHVILSGRRREALEHVAAEIGSNTLVLPFDATDLAGLPEVVEAAQNWRGSVDLLVNNAGISQRSLAADTSLEVYRALMEVDFFAPLRLTQLVLPAMTARGRGHIAIISSIAGKLGTPLRTGYCAAKHACVGYFEALRAEVEQAYGVDITVVLPGSVNTAIAVNALTADGSRRGHSDANIAEGLSPAAAAEEIAAALAARSREVVVARGGELEALTLRGQDPEALFDFMAAQGAQLAQARAHANGALTFDPARIPDSISRLE